jgi:hypothetical protein
VGVTDSVSAATIDKLIDKLLATDVGARLLPLVPLLLRLISADSTYQQAFYLTYNYFITQADFWNALISR